MGLYGVVKYMNTGGEEKGADTEESIRKSSSR